MYNWSYTQLMLFSKISPNDPTERLNTLTHVPGIIMGFLVLIVLSLKPAESFVHQMGYIIYAVTFILLFTASSIYHHTNGHERRKLLLKKIDHAAIYLFMGGCYTPFILVNMIGDYKIPFLILIWAITITGIVTKLFSKFKNPIVSVLLYVFFAFFCFVAKADFLDQIPRDCFMALCIGGGFYMSGIFFYLSEKLPHHHAIWHIFVLLGATSHFYAVYFI